MAGSPQNERSKGANENVSGGDGENICELLPDSASQNDDAKSLRHRKRTLRDSSHLSSYGRSSSSESNYRCSFANDVINDHSSEYASLAFQASPTPSLGTPSSEQNRPSTSASKSSPTQGLGRCQTAPCRYPNNDSQVSGDLQSHKHASRFRSIQLERLSEREKMRLIENLAKIKNDGTIEVDVMRSTPVASELLGIDVSDTRQLNTTGFESDQNKVIPKLNIAMLIVGTRGDVQPFVAIAKRLQEYGHRVRLATHANFCSFIRTFGIEFYPLRGDPRALAECKGVV